MCVYACACGRRLVCTPGAAGHHALWETCQEVPITHLPAALTHIHWLQVSHTAHRRWLSFFTAIQLRERSSGLQWWSVLITETSISVSFVGCLHCLDDALSVSSPPFIPWYYLIYWRCLPHIVGCGPFLCVEKYLSAYFVIKHSILKLGTFWRGEKETRN